MDIRCDSVLESPQLSAIRPCTSKAPETPKCDRQGPAPLPSPIATPVKTVKTVCKKKYRNLKPGTINTNLPYGIRPHLLQEHVSDLKRLHLNVNAIHTDTDTDKFRRIVEWDGTWVSTLTLPCLGYHADVKYLEVTFPDIYPRAGQFARRHQVWRDGPEPESGLSVDVFEAVDPGPLLTPEAVFDFTKYCEEKGQPEKETAAQKVAWEAQSERLRVMMVRASIETCRRSQNGSQTRWLTQR